MPPHKPQGERHKSRTAAKHIQRLNLAKSFAGWVVLLAALESCTDASHELAAIQASRHGATEFDAPTDDAEISRILEEATRAKVVVIGELHDDPHGSALAYRVLSHLTADGRCATIVLEMVARDEQPALDGFLRGDTTYASLCTQIGLNSMVASAHEHLLHFARRHKLRVVAGDAPQALVRQFCASKLEYSEFRASLGHEADSLMPSELPQVDAAAQERFTDTMLALTSGVDTPHRLAEDPLESLKGYYRGQQLRDESLAECVSFERHTRPECCVLLLAGVFHVADAAATVRRISQLSESDSIIAATALRHESGRTRFEMCFVSPRVNARGE